MKKKEYVNFATANPVCYIATSFGDQPCVRAVLLLFADESGFYFETLSPKDMSKQLHENPKVEVCFYNNPPELPQAKSMRLRGSVEFLNDPALKKRAYEERKFMDDIVGKSVEPYLEVFRIASGDLHFWTLGDILKEPGIEHIKF